MRAAEQETTNHGDRESKLLRDASVVSEMSTKDIYDSPLCRAFDSQCNVREYAFRVLRFPSVVPRNE